jgi:hypothetical protein
MVIDSLSLPLWPLGFPKAQGKKSVEVRRTIRHKVTVASAVAVALLPWLSVN